MNKKLKAEFNSLVDLSVLVQTYEEIAATRMRKVKNTVLQNRTFLSDLNNIYGYIETNYKNDVLKINIKKKLQLSNKLKGKVHIFLSANTGLYGEIMRNTFSLFDKETSKSHDNLVIIGRVGKKLYDEKHSDGKYQYFDFTDGVINQNTIKDILSYCMQYEEITVYHGLFISILSQKPVATKVTGDAAAVLADKSINDQLSKTSHIPSEDIFEPTLIDIVDFFERQILSALFEQSMYESNLSKFAARMLSLDLASSRITTNLKNTNFKLQKSQHNTLNRKQLDLMVSVMTIGDKTI